VHAYKIFRVLFLQRDRNIKFGSKNLYEIKMQTRMSSDLKINTSESYVESFPIKFNR